jgi:hypothetical protein
VSDRWRPLVTAACGTRGGTAGENDDAPHLAATAPGRPEGEVHPSVPTVSWARARRARGSPVGRLKLWPAS